MAELRNVIVFSLGAQRFAIELRWVREVVSLGFVTAVPTAPAALAGVCNLHGAILPVLDVAALLGHSAGAPARQGDGALVVEAEGVTCALRVDQVDRVATLPADDGIPLLEPAVLVRGALELVAAAAAEAIA